MKEKYTSHSEEETMRIAATLAAELHGGEVVLLEGELGAGKSVFVRGLAHALGVTHRMPSPTFVLMRVYGMKQTENREQRTKNRIPTPSHSPSRREEEKRKCSMSTSHSFAQSLRYFIHVDAYRVNDAQELDAIGLREWLGREDAIVAIEWGERVAPTLRDIRIIQVLLSIGRTAEMRSIHIVR
ncbi:MAG: tRNA (adenosine(37)-N6)-threonylcarbamoyltransferase complex ATPase subunit type 1 TsaE [Candidatus Uhrbacteria bacterium]